MTRRSFFREARRSTLVVLTFKDETSADETRDKLAGLQKQQLISLADAAVVVRKLDGKVKVKQAVNLVGAKIEPGHSALFLLVESWTEDKVMDEIKDFDAEVLQTSLSKEDEAKLKAAFGAHD